MILATILITLPVMGLLVAFDFWHCRDRSDRFSPPATGNWGTVSRGRPGR